MEIPMAENFFYNISRKDNFLYGIDYSYSYLLDHCSSGVSKGTLKHVFGKGYPESLIYQWFSNNYLTLVYMRDLSENNNLF